MSEPKKHWTDPIIYWIGYYSKKFRFWYCKKHGGRWLWWHMGLIEYSQLYNYMYDKDPDIKFYGGIDYATKQGNTVNAYLDDFLQPIPSSDVMVMYYGTNRQHRKFKSWLKKIVK